MTFAKATVAALRAALEENPEVALFNFDNNAVTNYQFKNEIQSNEAQTGPTA